MTQTAKVRFHTIDVGSDGQRLDNFLIKYCKGVPKTHIYKAIRSGQVRVNKSRAKADTRLVLKDVVRIPPFRMPQEEVRYVPAKTFPVIYEDEHLLVINKPSGVAVHGGSGVSFGVIEQLRRAYVNQPFLELVHRLDRDTSGLLMVAKTRKALVRLQDLLRQSNMTKDYLALVSGQWYAKGVHIKRPLLKYLTPHGERRVRVDMKEGKYAHTIVTTEQMFDEYTLVKARILTGRTHQIRVHLRSEGYPIVGDDKYGQDDVRAKFEQQGFSRMFLHAYHLNVPHPMTGERLDLIAPLSEACEQCLKSLVR
ncbi:MAG: RluA family pseudouridine synthase [Alcaligenaceae bacterium]|nr:RluA family pseudouridine synthase [Alcaligenaceae bacterium]